MSTSHLIPKIGSTEFPLILDGDELSEHQAQNIVQYIEGAIEGVESVKRAGVFTYTVTVAKDALANIRDLHREVIQVAYDFLLHLDAPTPTR